MTYEIARRQVGSTLIWLTGPVCAAFYVHVNGGVKKVSSSTGAGPSLRNACSSPMGMAIICPSLRDTSF